MKVLAAYRSVLRNPALSRLLFGEFVSSIGDWLYLVAILIVVYAASESAVLLGIIGAIRVLPYVLLSVPAGIVADRFDRRRILIVTDVARGLLMLAIAALVQVEAPIWTIVALTILAASFSAFFGPAIGSFLPSLVADERELGPANSAWASLDNLASVIGPAVAGLLIATGGLSLAFLLNAASFAVVAAVLWRLPTAPTVAEAVDEGASPVAEGPAPSGIREVVRPLAGIGLINVVGGFLFGGLGVLTVIIAVDVLRGGEAATGYLNAAMGVGGLLGALVSGALVLGRRIAPPLLGGSLVLGVSIALLGVGDSLIVALVVLGAATAGSLVVDVSVTTLFQRIVPDALRGRTIGVMDTVGIAAYALGAVSLPSAAALWGTGPVLLASGLVVIASSLAAVALFGPAATRPEPLTVAQQLFLGLPIFAGLPPGRLEDAARRLVPVSVQAGEVVIRQGDPADRFYLNAAGRFRVTQSAPDGVARTLRLMGPGDVFGEIGLLTGVPRTATVTAQEAGEVQALDGAEFLALAAAGPGLTTRLLDLHRGATPARA